MPPPLEGRGGGVLSVATLMDGRWSERRVPEAAVLLPDLRGLASRF